MFAGAVELEANWGGDWWGGGVDTDVSTRKHPTNSYSSDSLIVSNTITTQIDNVVC